MSPWLRPPPLFLSCLVFVVLCSISAHLFGEGEGRERARSMASFSDLFKLGKEVLKAETFVLHEAETRGVNEGVCVCVCSAELFYLVKGGVGA